MSAAFPGDPWDLGDWPWQAGTIRLLPVARRLEFARGVRAHLDFFRPEVVVLDLPRDARPAWIEAVKSLPSIRALRWTPAAGGKADPEWRIVDPACPLAEATRWALAAGAEVVAAGVAWPDAPGSLELPDPASLPVIGYAGYLGAVLLHRPAESRAATAERCRVLAAAAALAAAQGKRVAVLGDWPLAEAIFEACREPCATPLIRRARGKAEVRPVDPECLGEVCVEPPFLQAAWERGRTGEAPCLYSPPAGGRPPGKVMAFPGVPVNPLGDAADPDLDEEEASGARGEDRLARPRLYYRLVQQAARRSREEGGPEIAPAERRILHRLARNMALLEGRLCPDLYELVLCARAAVEDRFAREVLELAAHWPWGAAAPGMVRLSAKEVGLHSRLVTLRPRIDRLARRPALIEALRRRGFDLQFDPRGICSHLPEDEVVEGTGRQLARLGRARLHRSGVMVVPFAASLLDGLDPRETLRRMVFDGRPWVRQEIAEHGQVGAVVLIFSEGEGPGALERFPWCEVWYGEHAEESDMAFFATPPDQHPLAPGIHGALYGGFLLVWPPLRLGDVWHEPAYRFCETPAELLLAAALDYAVNPLIVFVSRRPPRPLFAGLARRLGRKIIHLRPGVLPAAKLRRLRRFHVLAGRDLREVAKTLIDPP